MNLRQQASVPAGARIYASIVPKHARAFQAAIQL
jgi:hypothetical protein